MLQITAIENESRTYHYSSTTALADVNELFIKHQLTINYKNPAIFHLLITPFSYSFNDMRSAIIIEKIFYLYLLTTFNKKTYKQN